MKKYLTYLLRVVLIIFVAAVALSPLFTNMAELEELGLTPRGYLPVALNAEEVTPTPTATLAPTPTPTSSGPPASDVRITFILYNPPGADVVSEYIEFENFGNLAQELKDWYVINSDGFNGGDADKILHNYAFPEYEIQPGETIRLWSKGGVDNPPDFYWNQASEVWENDGDFAKLFNTQSDLIDECHYGGGGVDVNC